MSRSPLSLMSMRKQLLSPTLMSRFLLSLMSMRKLLLSLMSMLRSQLSLMLMSRFPLSLTSILSPLLPQLLMPYVISSVVNATLIDVMNKAVEETNFTYNATYNSKYGYFITSINGLTAKSPEWWHILGGDDNISIPVGASCYVPENG